MKLFGWFEKWISEHGSAAILRDHLSLLQSQKAALELEAINLKAKMAELEKERDSLKAQLADLQSQLDNARKETGTLQSVRVSLKDQRELEAKIFQLQNANNNLEQMLRIKSIGF